MTFRIGYHNPALAFGKTLEHTLSGGNKPTEGATVLTFDNSTGTISVGDHVFASDESDADNQYLGKCTASSATEITVTNAVQNTPGTSLKIWVPTETMFFDYGERTGSQNQRVDTGTTLVRMRDATVLPMKHRDTSRSLTISFNPMLETNAGDLDTFIVTNRSGGSKHFSIGWWDHFHDVSRVSRVALLTQPFASVMVDKVVAQTTLTFFLETLDNYVTS